MNAYYALGIVLVALHNISLLNLRMRKRQRQRQFSQGDKAKSSRARLRKRLIWFFEPIGLVL